MPKLTKTSVLRKPSEERHPRDEMLGDTQHVDQCQALQAAPMVARQAPLLEIQMRHYLAVKPSRHLKAGGKTGMLGC